MTLSVKLQGDKYDITIIFEIDGYEENLLVYMFPRKTAVIIQ
jgi:hypothetical protein